MKEDLYALLGVPRNAKAKQIERAYLKLARKIHPDVNPGNRQSVVRFREVQQAYLVLSSKKSRSLYDRQGEVAPSILEETATAVSRGRAGETRGWERIIREIFHEEGSLEPETGAVRGADVHTVLEVPFHESMRGATREVYYQREVTCTHCAGRRFDRDAGIVSCPGCGGSGLTTVQRGPYAAKKICVRCAGEGEVGSRLCPGCGGKGRKLVKERRKVEVPAGCDSGSTIVIPEKGHPGTRGGSPGGLVVTLKVLPHPEIERKGYNLHCTVSVSLAEAALGAAILVPTAERKVSLSLPAGTQGGQQFRIEGRGVPLPGGRRRGDLYVTINVRIPAADTPKARELFRQIEEMFPDRPRVRT